MTPIRIDSIGGLEEQKKIQSDPEKTGRELRRERRKNERKRFKKK